MVTSLRFWLIASFSTILFICLLGAGLFINALNKSKKLEDYHSDLKTTRILVLEINKLKEDILLGNLNETQFYESRSSAPEIKFQQLNSQTRYYLDKLARSKITSGNGLQWKMNGIKKEFANYNTSYNELIYLFKLKGFKDYGLEGKMRDHAHAIYDYDNQDVKFYCLMLRRHEKDFLLRKDNIYVQKFNTVMKELMDFIYGSSIGKEGKNYLLNQLYYYDKYFKQLARIENKIGAKGREGYIHRSKRSFDKIAGLIEEMDNELRLIKEAHKEKLSHDTLIVFIVLVTFLVGTIIVLTQLITRSVKTISNAFNSYINAAFNMDAISSFKRTKIKEFNGIYINFMKMAREINIFTNFFREKVLERTLEINKQKDEILLQQEKIEKQYMSLLKKTTELKRQKQLLALKNTDIHDSLRYAKRIQKAIQPKVSTFKECFGDSFIFSKARDVVSGDFYLVYKLTQEQKSRIVLVASDCTGHGVPGAIMSVLGINTLNKLIKEMQYSDPGIILNSLDRDITRVLAHGKHEDDIVADGMDISVFSFDPDTYVLDYSIAKFSHYLVRNSEVLSLDTQKISIGYNPFDKGHKEFSTQSYQLQHGDCLYLFSDGFGDQFGGPLNKKYKKSNIKQFIESIHTQSMDEQRKLFKQEFKAWKGIHKQIDDVTVIGIRF